MMEEPSIKHNNRLALLLVGMVAVLALVSWLLAISWPVGTCPATLCPGGIG